MKHDSKYMYIYQNLNFDTFFSLAKTRFFKYFLSLKGTETYRCLFNALFRAEQLNPM